MIHSIQISSKIIYRQEIHTIRIHFIQSIEILVDNLHLQGEREGRGERGGERERGGRGGEGGRERGQRGEKKRKNEL